MSAVTGYLSSLRADLADRRVLPIVVLLAVLLLGAVGYSIFGGGEAQTPVAATAPSAPAAPAGSSASAGITVTQFSKGARGSVAEVTSGGRVQHAGPTRDPLAPPKGHKASHLSVLKAAKSKGSTAAKSPSSPSVAGGTSPSTPAKSTTPVAPVVKKPAYQADVLFGVAPAGTTTALTSLPAFENIKDSAKLPSSKEGLIEFEGVTGDGKYASFRFLEPAIVTGPATCKPSATQCQLLELKAGQFVELEYAPANGGAAVVYQLQIASIAATG